MTGKCCRLRSQHAGQADRTQRRRVPARRGPASPGDPARGRPAGAGRQVLAGLMVFNAARRTRSRATRRSTPCTRGSPSARSSSTAWSRTMPGGTRRSRRSRSGRTRTGPRRGSATTCTARTDTTGCSWWPGRHDVLRGPPGRAGQGRPRPALGSELWRPLVAAGRATPPGSPRPARLPADAGRQLGIASVAAITAETSGPGPRPAGQRYVLMVVRRLTPDWLEELASALHLRARDRRRASAPARGCADGPRRHGRAGGQDPAAAGLPLTGPDGRPWSGRSSGSRIGRARNICARSLPSLGIALLLFVAVRLVGAAPEPQQHLGHRRERDPLSRRRRRELGLDLRDRRRGPDHLDLGPLHRPDRHPHRARSTAGRWPSSWLPMSGDEVSRELDRALQEERLFRGPAALLPRPRGPAAQPARLGQADPRCRRPPCRLARHRRRRHGRDRGPKAAEFLSGHDALTGCLNRSGLIEGIAEVLEAARRRDERAAFLMLDLDGFKGINDIYGPIVGDQIIQPRPIGWRPWHGRATWSPGPVRTSSSWSGRR